MEDNINILDFNDIITYINKDIKNVDYFWIVHSCIRYEFKIMHPEVYMNYIGFISYYKPIIPVDDALNLLQINNMNDFITYCYKVNID
jgi:hypothetical protein